MKNTVATHNVDELHLRAATATPVNGTRAHVGSARTHAPAVANDANSRRAEPSPDGLLQLGLAFWGSQVLLTAVDLGVFTLLAAGPKNVEDLTRALNLHERSTRDFFDALVALKVLERENGFYRNTPETARFLDRNQQTYVGGLLEMSSARLYRSWGCLMEALRTGKNQNGIQGGKEAFSNFYQDPAQLRQFAQAMTGISMGAARALAAKFHWAEYQSFVDVGCAQGCVPVQLALAHPHLKGVGFDLAPVGPVFDEYVKSLNLQDRLKFHAGDMFSDAPLPQTDVLIFGHILHDWDLPTKRQLLAKAYASLKPGGAVIVYEALIDDDRRHNAFGLLMSLNMLIETEGGFDYTGADCMGWMRETGFRETRVEHLIGPDSMVIGIK